MTSSSLKSLKESNQVLTAFMAHNPTNIVVWDRTLDQYLIVPNPDINPQAVRAAYPVIQYAQGVLMDFQSLHIISELNSLIRAKIGINYQEIRQRYVIAGTQTIYYIKAFEATALQMSPEFQAAVAGGRTIALSAKEFGVK